MEILLFILILAVIIGGTILLVSFGTRFREDYGRSTFHWQFILLTFALIYGVLAEIILVWIIAIVLFVLAILYFSPKYGLGKSMLLAVFNLIGVIAIIVIIINILKAIDDLKKRINKK